MWTCSPASQLSTGSGAPVSRKPCGRALSIGSHVASEPGASKAAIVAQCFLLDAIASFSPRRVPLFSSVSDPRLRLTSSRVTALLDPGAFNKSSRPEGAELREGFRNMISGIRVSALFPTIISIIVMIATPPLWIPRGQGHRHFRLPRVGWDPAGSF